MTKAKKKNLKIIVATAMCLFTLTGLFTGTLAWFASNQAVTATGMSVRVAGFSSVDILSCYAVRYDGTYGAIAIDISGGNQNITMSEYDRVFLDRNVNTPLFIRMELTNFNTDEDLSVTIPCSGTYKTDNKVNPYLSNVVAARFMRGIKDSNDNVVADTNSWTGSTAYTNAVISSYQGMVSNIKNATATPFVSGNNKNSSITLTIPAEDAFDEDFIVTRKDANNNDIDVVVVYVAFDYYVTNNVNLVISYLDSNGSDPALSFTSDIQVITLDNEGN